MGSTVDPQQSDAESRPATAGAIPPATPATKRAIGRGDWGTVAIGTHPISIRLLVTNRRAESVKKWFTSHGLQDMDFSTVGFGAKKPVAPNTTSAGSDDPTGRAKNRRVEIVITK